MSTFEAFFDERPVPKGRPRFANGRTHTPPATIEYEATLVYWMRQEAERCGWTMAEGDVYVRITLYFNAAGRAPGDLDNYAKAITDAANKVLYQDDRQISRLVVERHMVGTDEGFWLRVSSDKRESEAA